MVTFSHQHLILQCASTFRVARCGLDSRTCGDADHLGVDGAVLLSVAFHIDFHHKGVVALGQCDCLAKGHGYFCSCSSLTKFCLTLPYAHLTDISLCALQVEIDTTHGDCIEVTLGLYVHVEQFLVGSTDRSIGCTGLSSLNGSNGHVLGLIL